MKLCEYTVTVEFSDTGRAGRHYLLSVYETHTDRKEAVLLSYIESPRDATGPAVVVLARVMSKAMDEWP